jgi:hypothetical protein
MRNLIAAMAIAAAIGPLPTPPAAAAPTHYVFEQTSTTMAGLVVTGEIEINGGFADLPSLTNSQTCNFLTRLCGPVDFGRLLDIAVGSNRTEASLTLHELHPSLPGDYPAWDIVPDGDLDPGIRWVDARDLNDIFINGWENSVIETDTDNASSPCWHTRACVVTGHWVAAALPVPEPGAITLLATGLLFLVGARLPTIFLTLQRRYAAS